MGWKIVFLSWKENKKTEGDQKHKRFCLLNKLAGCPKGLLEPRGRVEKLTKAVNFNVGKKTHVH